MLTDKKRRPLSNPEVKKEGVNAGKIKRIKVSIIFNLTTHRMMKALAATEGMTISDLMQDLAYSYLKEKGKV